MNRILKLGKQGVVDLVRGQTVNVVVACVIVAIGLISVSSAPGMLSVFGSVGFVIPMGGVYFLTLAAHEQAVPKGDRFRSGWPYEGALLLGAALIFSTASLGTFTYLAIVSAADHPAPITLLAMLVAGNGFVGFLAYISYRQRITS
ncbi:MAG: hypothetical protein B7Y90_06420 [Alphaproteobacteria bacterium 32-64-14]|nr:MAG: hypothetical protein B7Y90_06420 [Alphaproteobacteria bacterium 32-64-14]